MSSGKKNSGALPPWKHGAYDRHRLKVTKATAAVDVDPPKVRPHVLLNAKRMQLERENQARILRENFILLKKLRDIMHRKRSAEQNCRLKWQESRLNFKLAKQSMEEELENYGEEEGELDEYSSRQSSLFEDKTIALSHSEAGECLHTLGKCDSGLGYAYLGLNASNKNLTDVRVIASFKYVVYVDVSGNRLSTEALEVLSSMTYLLMLQADRNLLTSAELKPMPYLQVLTLNKNKLSTTSGISHSLLEFLELKDNNIEEVNMNPYIVENLKVLELRGNMLATTNGIFFPSLARLYLAENRIERLEGLEILINLKILHLRTNRITNLDGFDKRCGQLNYLNVRNNEIAKISELEKLKCLPNLETLIVFENPAVGAKDGEEAEAAYRHLVLAMLPNLKRIDKDPVLHEEREAAAEFRREMIRDGKKFTDFDTDFPNE